MRSILSAALLLFVSCSFGQSYYLFVGTYTNKGSKGIYVYKFDASTGKTEYVSNTEGTVNPSYLAIAPDQKHVYSVTETATENSGSVSAFSFDKTSGKLSFINKQSSGGDNPVYVSVHKSNKWIVIGNYSGGSLAAFPINADGSLQPYSQLIQHTGSSINKTRQDKPHVHSAILSPDNKYILTPDLGLDKINIYRFKASKQKPLQQGNQPFAATTPGSGPRHFAFHPNNKYGYVIEEITGTIVAYKYRKGKLKVLQRVDTHPEN